MIRIRTSISLPVETVDLLLCHQKGFDRLEGLAKACLRKHIRHIKLDLNGRATCRYNRVGPHKIVNIWLTPEEHRSLKAYRMILNISVSYMFALAIEKYLKGIANTSRRFWHPRYAWNWQSWLEGNLAQMGHIHRSIRFQNDRSIFAVCITILRPRSKGRFLPRRTYPPGPWHT